MFGEFATAKVYPGKLNALVKTLMSQMGISDPNEAVRRINSREWIVVKSELKWHEKDGVIYFTVTSDGTTGPEWIERLEKKGFRVSDYAKSVLRSADFKPTDGVTTEVAVLKGSLFSNNDRITRKIRAEAKKRNLTTPNAEVACLIREKLSDEKIKEMGLGWIVAMHEPIKGSGGDLRLLSVDRDGGGRWLLADDDLPGSRWVVETGFAFVVS